MRKCRNDCIFEYLGGFCYAERQNNMEKIEDEQAEFTRCKRAASNSAFFISRRKLRCKKMRNDF